MRGRDGKRGVKSEEKGEEKYWRKDVFVEEKMWSVQGFFGGKKMWTGGMEVRNGGEKSKGE